MSWGTEVPVSPRVRGTGGPGPTGPVGPGAPGLGPTFLPCPKEKKVTQYDVNSHKTTCLKSTKIGQCKWVHK